MWLFSYLFIIIFGWSGYEMTGSAGWGVVGAFVAMIILVVVASHNANPPRRHYHAKKNSRRH